MKKMILVSALLTLLLPIMALGQKNSEAYTPCINESYRDSMVVNNPYHYLDSAEMMKLSSEHPKGWNGKTIYLSKKLYVESFQLLPWIGTCKATEKHFDVSYCGEWHISKSSVQHLEYPEEYYLIGLFFCIALLVLLIAVAFKIPRRRKLALLTYEYRLQKYKNNFFADEQWIKYGYAILISFAYPVRLVITEGYSMNALLVLSMLWWMTIIFIIGHIFRNILINSRLAKLK